MKTGKEISAGGVIYKDEGAGIKIALIALKNKQIWALPKGKLERGESPDEAALREVKEETGLEGEIKSKIGDIAYEYYSKERDTRYSKTVTFYLMRNIGESSRRHDWEVDDCQWFPIDEALKVMSYKSEREMVERAKAVLLE